MYKKAKSKDVYKHNTLLPEQSSSIASVPSLTTSWTQNGVETSSSYATSPGRDSRASQAASGAGGNLMGSTWQQTAASVPAPAQPSRGLKPGVSDELIRGRTPSEKAGDIVRPVGTLLGNVVGATAGMVTGISISTTSNSGPTFKRHGACTWHVGFNTTGRNGWIVQDIVNTWRAEDALGHAVASPATPHYYEAWRVDAAGNVTPKVGSDNDYWDNPNLKTKYGAVEGHWSTKGKLYFTTVNPATQGFTRNNPATNAGRLLSSTTAPAALKLGLARHHRYAQGTWESSGVHTGSMGP